MCVAVLILGLYLSKRVADLLLLLRKKTVLRQRDTIARRRKKSVTDIFRASEDLKTKNALGKNALRVLFLLVSMHGKKVVGGGPLVLLSSLFFSPRKYGKTS